ncbi:hypothetical protein GCM10012275_59620 [Longimycelium tulufanense]|uniref:Resolvase/invertase-type recombinase catalytic domain-containing protein n=1 Tax=Longimycelium tulufanense TaxID=907463 RepID=A0A8J3CK02_9PSEU|nr:recombinase family protein [Longimycelium tulufanense]GGM81046.1 hypothetical protein GCM10012275_59620 [Longimycelium tulufanense]
MSPAPTEPGRREPRAALNNLDSVRVGIYTRWPSNREDNFLQSYVESRPSWHIAQRFSDHASGATLNRPGLHQVLDVARAGGIDILLIGNVHSLSRTPGHLAHLLHELISHGVAVESVTDGSINVSTPAGQFQVRTLGSFADFEDEVLDDR